MSPPPLPPGAIPIAAGETMSVKEHDELLDMQKVVYGYTVPIHVDCRAEDEIEMGTGIVIEIGNRTFVASVGHVLSKNPRVLFGKNPTFGLDGEPTKYLKREYRDPPNDLGDTPITQVMDIGFLEVPNGSHHTTCFFESLVDLVPPPLTLTMIVGHPIDAPGSLSESVLERKQRYELIRTAHSASIQEVRDNKFVFGYPKDLLTIDSNTRKMTEAKSYKTPKGFSGGGLWVKRALSVIPGIIYPGSLYRLLGLDYAWSSRRREAYCVPIRYWVKLVYDNYPDLHEIIEKQFPNIADVQL